MTHNTNAIPTRDARLILAAVCLACLTLPLGFSGGAIATPAIGRAFAHQGADPAQLAWITNAFMLSFGSLLMAAGALADVLGRRRVFGAGLALYVLSSLALCLAPSLLVVNLLRGLQGVAAAATLAAGSAALAQVFEGRARLRAFSLLGTSFGLGLSLGPVVSGWLVQHFGWQAVFLCIGGFALLALVFGPPRMHETRDPDAAGVDWPGTLGFSGALGSLTFALIAAPERGWTHPLTLLLLLASGVLLAWFIRVELRARRPMLDLSLFANARFVGVQLLPVGTCYGFVVLLILLPLRFIGIDGIDEWHAGLMMLALSAPMLVVPSLAARLAHHVAPGRLSALGLLIAAAGLCWLAHGDGVAARWQMLGAMLVIGAGTGLPWGLMDGLSVSVVPKERAGMASGIFSTSRVAGEGVALAVVSAMLVALVQAVLPATSDARVAQALGRGDLAHALEQAVTPQLTAAALHAAYGQAFALLCYCLATITVACAALTLLLLRETTAASTASAPVSTT